MSQQFNFTGLHPLFLAAVRRREPTITFNVACEGGQFIFMLLIPTDEYGSVAWDDIAFYVTLVRTGKLLKLKLYGNHYKAGDFKIFPSAEDERFIRLELGITGAKGGPPFLLSQFLGKLNALIPPSVTLPQTVDCIRTHKELLQPVLRNYVHEADKIYFLGIRRLPQTHRPREETLRKLLMLQAPRAAVVELIERLKALNYTTCWTAVKPGTYNFQQLFARSIQDLRVEHHSRQGDPDDAERAPL